MPEGKNKRVAKNAVALAIRMIMVMLIGLFTTRIVLRSLGVIDYGIYGVIGGVIGMASFLNFSMASASSRFITLELGKGDVQSMKEVFSSSMFIMLGLCGLVFIIAETVGLWFLNNRMVFPPDKMIAVNILYQFTVISMIFTYTQVPYTAEILAHENMQIYAYIEIFNTLSKLLIAFSLYLFPKHRLIYYALLILILSVSVTLFYRIYAIKHYKEARLTRNVKRSGMINMIKFAGYDLFGNMCVSVRSQGQPIILNIFYGVISNAGASIASTLSNCLSGFTSSVSQAFRPQIIKQYASGNIGEMEIMVTRSAQFSLLAFSCLTVPFLIVTPQIVTLWLGENPQYTVSFVRLMAISVGVNALSNITLTGVYAQGNIRTVSFLTGLCHLLSLVLGYIILRMGGEAWNLYAIGLAMNITNLCITFYYLKKHIPKFKLNPYLTKILKNILVIIVSALPIIGILTTLGLNNRTISTIENLSIITAVTLLYNVILGIITYYLTLSYNERLILTQFIRSKIGR